MPCVPLYYAKMWFCGGLLALLLRLCGILHVGGLLTFCASFSFLEVFVSSGPGPRSSQPLSMAISLLVI